MRAMVFYGVGQPLKLIETPAPQPMKGQVLIRVLACGVCRTDLHIIDGELNEPHLPLILGHQIIGEIVQINSTEPKFSLGERVGVPWLGKSCGTCSYCLSQKENLCEHSLYTGYQLNGGFADYCVANQDFIFSVPKSYSPTHAAPLLCAGLIGYRSLKFAKDAKSIGFYGFGSAAHLMIQIAKFQNKHIYVFTRDGDSKSQQFAKKLGASWVGGVNETPPDLLDAAIIFAPAGELIPKALAAVKRGGSVICAGIHMSAIPSFPYNLLYGERVLRSVTNLTKQDGYEFFQLLEKFPVQTHIQTYALEKANDALNDLKNGAIQGSVVLQIV